MELISPEARIFIFFVTTSVAIASLHIGLIRLSFNLDPKIVEEKERGGVLIVIQFALVSIICSSIPLAMDALFSACDKFFLASWITPIVISALTLIDARRTHESNCDLYYKIIVILVLIACIAIMASLFFDMDSFKAFVLSLAVALAVMATQLFKSSLRIGRVIV